jgi:hypothetical protein
MAIVNRDLDVSEQKDVIKFNRLLAATGATLPMWVAPYPFEIVEVNLTARALSGAPTARVDVYKFGGTTSISAMVLLTIPAYATSGALTSASLAAAGSTHVQGAAGDMLVLTTAAANTACDDLVATVVIKKLQDIVSTF